MRCDKILCELKIGSIKRTSLKQSLLYGFTKLDISAMRNQIILNIAIIPSKYPNRACNTVGKILNRD